MDFADIDCRVGMFARTLVQAERLPTTARGGPPMEDVHRWIVRSLSKGCVIDDCICLRHRTRYKTNCLFVSGSDNTVPIVVFVVPGFENYITVSVCPRRRTQCKADRFVCSRF